MKILNREQGWMTDGAGKSTLMKILNREQGLDDGRIIYEQDLKLDSRINEVIEQLGLDANAQLASLSGGWLRKAALGRASVVGARAAAG